MELPASLEIPFRLRDYDGLVTVSYGVDRDPAFWGFDTPGLLYQPLDLELAKGFPVCEARIAYEGPGYHALMGWIQLISASRSCNRRCGRGDRWSLPHALWRGFSLCRVWVRANILRRADQPRSRDARLDRRYFPGSLPWPRIACRKPLGF